MQSKIVTISLIFILWLLMIVATFPVNAKASITRHIKYNDTIHNHIMLDGKADEYLQGKDSKDLANEANKELERQQDEYEAQQKKEAEIKARKENEAQMEYIGDFEITAYSYSEGGGENYRTAGGYTPSPYYTVAVDPSVIPLGTILYIEGIGEVQAQDTGGAVQGNIIDYHIGYDNCDSFGRQEHKVYIIN